MKKIFLMSAAVLGSLLFSVSGSAQAQSTYQQTIDRNLLLSQIQEVKRQIIILQIQLIQIRIAELQRQLEQLNTNSARAFIDILYPNGGEKLENQHCYNILWESSGIDRVSIGLDAGSNGTIVADNVRAADGRYNWCAGNVEGDDYRIRIFDPTRQNIGDISSASFSIFDNADGKHCSDGTVFGKCSTDKPKLCIDEEVDLADACHSCGCPSGSYCGSDSKCH
ncbi:MAG: hypothetical protein WCX69_04025 [Candidatus Paceibacterota bacterium]